MNGNLPKFIPAQIRARNGPAEGPASAISYDVEVEFPHGTRTVLNVRPSHKRPATGATWIRGADPGDLAMVMYRGDQEIRFVIFEGLAEGEQCDAG